MTWAIRGKGVELREPKRPRKSSPVRIAQAVLPWLALLAIAALPAWRLSASPLPHYHLLDSRQGLSHSSIGALLEDRQGFLWIGTLDGLNRYDGVDLTTWRHHADDPASLSANIVYALLEDRCGNLWVGTSRGLDFLARAGWNAHRFRRVRIPDGEGLPRDTPVRALNQDADGVVWAGLGDGLLRYAAEDQIEVLRHAPEDPTTLPAGQVFDLDRDPTGHLWVLTRETRDGEHQTTLSRLLATENRFDHVAVPAEWNVSGFLVAPDGVLWFNAPGLATYDPRGRGFEQPILAVDFSPLADLERDATGALWITTTEGFLRYSPSTDEVWGRLPLDTPDDHLAGLATAFAEGRDGLRWLGTRSGLFLVDPHRKPFSHRRLGDDGNPQGGRDRISAVLVDAVGELWLGTYGTGLHRLDSPRGGTVTYRHGSDPRSLCHDTIWDLAEDPSGDLWIADDEGLCRWHRAEERFQRIAGIDVDGQDSAVARRSLRRIEIAPSGTLWLAHETGLHSYRPNDHRLRRHPPTGSDPELAHSLHLDAEGILWIGTQGARLLSFDTRRETWSQHPLRLASGQELSSEGIFDLLPAGDGSLWLASGDGLSRYAPGRGLVEHYDTGNGLPGSSVFSLLEAPDGRLWLGTNQGLSRFTPGPGGGPTFRNYRPSDGLGNLEFNRHAAAVAPDGTFLFGGMEGLTYFRPSALRDNPVTPRMALTEVRFTSRDGERRFTPRTDDSLVLDHDEASFTVDYAALSFTDARRNRYQVRLEGLESGWVDQGTRRSVRYHRVPPGRYRLRVRGSNNDGRWSQGEATLGIEVRPAIWQTWWFRGLILALLLALLFAGHRVRVHRLIEIERLRLRIADDLHDDLSSDLSGIALAMELLQRGGLTVPDAGRVARVRERALVLLERLRDIVWCVDPAHDRQEALVQKLRSTAETLLPRHRYELSCELEGGTVPLPVRRGLLLVFKEALHNVVRHAEARRLDLRLRQADDSLVLVVRDDGRGFDPATAVGGSGLASMGRRARALKGRLDLVSRPGAGTEVRLEVPMRGRLLESGSRELGMAGLRTNGETRPSRAPTGTTPRRRWL